MCVLCVEEPSMDFLPLFLSSCCLNPRTLQATTASCARDFMAELCAMQRNTCFCFEPAICCLSFMPAHSCSRRDSKRIIRIQFLCVTNEFIQLHQIPLFTPTLLSHSLKLSTCNFSTTLLSVSFCHLFWRCIVDCLTPRFAKQFYYLFSILQFSTTHFPLKALLSCPSVLKRAS